MAAFWLPECRCSPGGFEGLGLAFLGCAASGSRKRPLGVRSAFLGLQRRLRPGRLVKAGNRVFSLIGSVCKESPDQLSLQRCDRCRARSTCGLPMSGKYEGCCSLVVLPSVPPRTSRCGSYLHRRERPGSNPGSVIFFLQFFCCYALLASFCAYFQVCRRAGAAPWIIVAAVGSANE